MLIRYLSTKGELGYVATVYGCLLYFGLVETLSWRNGAYLLYGELLAMHVQYF